MQPRLSGQTKMNSASSLGGVGVGGWGWGTKEEREALEDNLEACGLRTTGRMLVVGSWERAFPGGHVPCGGHRVT